jgi:hypothetical protein
MLVNLEKHLLFLSKKYTKYKSLIFRTPPDPRLKFCTPCKESAPPLYPDPAFGRRSRMTTTPWPNGHPKSQVNLILSDNLERSYFYIIHQP